MSNAKHAPGPWTAQGLAIVASDRSFVGRVYPWCADPQDAECAKANASLIAAAPELLEALEDLMEAVKDHYEAGGYEWKHALAAIAKAKGES